MNNEIPALRAGPCRELSLLTLWGGGGGGIGAKNVGVA